jgi:hypothetical protein
MSHNLLSKKEWEDKRRYLSANLKELVDKEKEVKTKLGLSEYFLK